MVLLLLLLLLAILLAVKHKGFITGWHMFLQTSHVYIRGNGKQQKSSSIQSKALKETNQTVSNTLQDSKLKGLWHVQNYGVIIVYEILRSQVQFTLTELKTTEIHPGISDVNVIQKLCANGARLKKLKRL